MVRCKSSEAPRPSGQNFALVGNAPLNNRFFELWPESIPIRGARRCRHLEERDPFEPSDHRRREPPEPGIFHFAEKSLWIFKASSSKVEPFLNTKC